MSTPELESYTPGNSDIEDRLLRIEEKIDEIHTVMQAVGAALADFQAKGIGGMMAQMMGSKKGK